MCLGTQGVVSILVFCKGNKKNDINKEDSEKFIKNLFLSVYFCVFLSFYGLKCKIENVYVSFRKISWAFCLSFVNLVLSLQRNSIC